MSNSWNSGKNRKRKREIGEVEGRKKQAFVPERGHSSADQSTRQYFIEVKQHFDQLDDTEQQHQLVENALEEANGREPQIATDAMCSRVLEVFLPHASSSTFIRFLRAFLANGNFSTIARK